MSCIHSWQCSFWEGFFRVSIWGYFLFHQSPQWVPKYTSAENTTTVLANCYKKGSVEHSVMKSHIREQSLRKLLCSNYVRIFPLSPWVPMGSQISLSRIHERSFRKLLPEIEVISLWDELTDQKYVSQKGSFTFWTDVISFISVGLNAIQGSPSQVPQRQC